MKKAFILLMSLAAMLVASMGLKAQEITITLDPGWNWISYPNAEAMDIASALGDFVPMEGDIIKSQFGNSQYYRGRWSGAVTHFIPGKGYKYYSSRTEDVEFVFAQPVSSNVETATPTDVTATSALVGGMVVLPEGSQVFLRGVCWGTEPNPDIYGSHTSDGTGIGSFTTTLDSLAPGTTYYVRAYMVNEYGLAYGNAVSFTTIPIWTVEATPNPTDGGTITGAGDYEQNAVCTLTAIANEGYVFANWTENGEVVSTDATYTFTVDADRTLVANFTYNGSGNAPTGAIDGLFSVSASLQVYFSQGNLQYQASTNTWRFADNQYDYVGSANSNISSTYSGWIDLFGWGTSGYHDANDPYNVNYQPWSTSTSQVNSSYNYWGYGPSTNMTDPNLTGTSANYDWGVYNPISNGGNQTNQWRTLTQSEWAYVFNTRTTTSGIRYAKANVNNVNGVILLPDDWDSSTYSLSNTNSSGASFSSNTMTASQWSTLEQAGAVFLPAAGCRFGTSVSDVGSLGHYWSASYSDSSYARRVDFGGGYLGTGSNSNRYYGFSVRLARVAEN